MLDHQYFLPLKTDRPGVVLVMGDMDGTSLGHLINRGFAKIQFRVITHNFDCIKLQICETNIGYLNCYC